MQVVCTQYRKKEVAALTVIRAFMPRFKYRRIFNDRVYRFTTEAARRDFINFWNL